MEFWNENLTKESWKKLQEMTKEFDFVLIGGWAAYLWTKQHKSKDIDIIVNYETLDVLKGMYRLEKNERLKKYEIKLDKFDIDIYVPYFSKLSVPLEEVMKETKKIQGIKTVEAEILLILKQGAEIDRRNSVKGIKDSIDIITLLIYAPIDIQIYKKFLKKYKVERYSDELKTVIKKFDIKNLKYINKNFQEFNKWKKEILKKLNSIY